VLACRRGAARRALVTGPIIAPQPADFLNRLEQFLSVGAVLELGVQEAAPNSTSDLHSIFLQKILFISSSRE
jgi:hypothetical protein